MDPLNRYKQTVENDFKLNWKITGSWSENFKEDADKIIIKNWFDYWIKNLTVKNIENESFRLKKKTIRMLKRLLEDYKKIKDYERNWLEFNDINQ